MRKQENIKISKTLMKKIYIYSIKLEHIMSTSSRVVLNNKGGGDAGRKWYLRCSCMVWWHLAVTNMIKQVGVVQ